MGENFADKAAENQKKLENEIAKESEQVQSIEHAVLRSLALSWDTVMEHAVKPKIAELVELFKPKEAREQFRQCGKNVLAREDKEMFDAYAENC